MVPTARQACNPPRAATFLATISSADNVRAVGEVFGQAFSESAKADEIRMVKVFRSISGTSQRNRICCSTEYKTSRTTFFALPQTSVRYLSTTLYRWNDVSNRPC